MARCFNNLPSPGRWIIAFLAMSVSLPVATGTSQSVEEKPASTGFAKTVRPILVAKCFGCHQTARSSGGLVMTDFQQMLAGGESGDSAIVPGDPDNSYLMELITPVDGKAQMPPDDEALSAAEIEAIRVWITAGAVDDYQQSQVNFSADNPPVYNRQPNITSLDYSPDGSLLAVSGFHEVLLVDTSSLTAQVSTGSSTSETTAVAKYAGRLIGLSPRIESVRFSPDGRRIAAVGGSPGEFGEVQIWNVAERTLELSKIIGDDTIDGVNWSPDSMLVSFGCKDTTLRVIDASTGEQVLFQGAHDDWIRDTVFSPDGKQLVSVGRDMTCKLTEVATQRFVDNISSITPGVLKGGIASVARHPTRDEIVIGGADGIPKVYRMNRITKRVIGDDANLVRLLPSMPGRINSVAVSHDGKRIVAASSLDGKGFLRVYSYDFDPTVSEELKAILAKLPGSWSPEERQKVDAYNTADVVQISAFDLDTTGFYSVTWNPDNKSVVVGGNDGQLRVIDAASGAILANANLVATEAGNVEPSASRGYLFDQSQSSEAVATEPNIEYQTISVSPAELNFSSPMDYAQVVVTATRGDGTIEDVTRFTKFGELPSLLFRTDSLLQPTGEGAGELSVAVGNATAMVKVHVDFANKDFLPDFRTDVNPVMTKIGCNAGTCHGSQDGKKGFKLSLRGYDPEFDVRALTDDMNARRINHAWPEQSLMLLKPSASVAHAGGRVFKPHDRYYNLIREWVAGGAKLDLESPRVATIELFPINPVLESPDALQQFRVIATMADGQQRDVTRETFIEIGNTEVASVNGSVVKATRRGETPILARYDGAYTATTLTVMGNREGFAWTEPEVWTDIDRFVADKWKRMKIQPSELCSDAEFVRRIYLDLTGLPPDSETTQQFLDDERPTKIKRDELVDSLVGNAEYVEHWSNKWADLLQVNRKYLGAEGAVAFRDWIRDQVRSNRPYDELAYEILTASGSNRLTPAASYFKIHRTPVDTMENTTHLFLATRFNCNKCHDHPFERWTQNQYFETASYFSQVSLDRDEASGDKMIGGSAVEGATPLYEIVGDNGSGQLLHDRTGNNVEPKLPFDCDYEVNPNATRREQLASWVTSPDNPYFATSYVNRLWGYMMGTGLIEPLDDIRAGNPATNPQLLEYLTKEFVANQFNTQQMIKLICKSRTYQLSIVPNEFNNDDTLNYSHAKARRLPAEVLFDSIYFVTGSQLMIPGVPPGTRAAALPDSGVALPSGFLATLGRPARESVCECERSSELQLGSVLAMVSGPDVARAINDSESALARLVVDEPDDRRLVEQIYMRILNRSARAEEVTIVLDDMTTLASEHVELAATRDARQLLVTQQLPELEQQRTDAIASTTGQLEAKIAEVDPTLLEKEAAHAQAIIDTQQSLDAYESNENGLAGWQQRQLGQVRWAPLLLSKFESVAGRVAKVLTDRSLLISGEKGKDVFTVQAATDLSGISAVRLEMLPDDSLASKGPGLSRNGNLVLTELQMEIAHPDRPDDWQPVQFASAIANFEQDSFPPTDAIDGVTDNNKGWALMGRQGKPSWAVFQLKIPVGYANGSLVRFKMHQSYDEEHQAGRFRISLTRYDQPIGLGLDEALAAELLSDESTRSEETRSALREAFQKSDARYAELSTALAAAKQPLPIDAEIVALREKLERVSQPVPPDSMLVRLSADVETSQHQLENHRLTAAQDLAWALINSPAFLFNR